MNQGSTQSAVDSRPRYLQAADALAAFLREQRLQPGDLLPPTEELARRIGVSRSTLREAMGYLEQEGRLQRRQGVGTFVTSPPGGHLVYGLEELTALRSLGNLAGLNLELIGQWVAQRAATEELASLFKLPPGAPLARVQAVMALGGRPIAYFDSVVPPDRIDLERFSAEDLTILEHLMEYGQPEPIYTRSELYAVKADPVVAEYLRVEAGEALLKIAEVYDSSDDEPVASSIDYLLTDMVRYHIIRRVVRRTGRPGTARNGK